MGFKQVSFQLNPTKSKICHPERNERSEVQSKDLQLFLLLPFFHLPEFPASTEK